METDMEMESDMEMEVLNDVRRILVLVRQEVRTWSIGSKVQRFIQEAHKEHEIIQYST